MGEPASLDRVQECHRLVEEHGLSSMDLTLHERYLLNNGRYHELADALMRRHTIGCGQDAEMNISDGYTEFGIPEPEPSLEEKIDNDIFEQLFGAFREIPKTAKLMFSDEDFSVHYDSTDGSVYITESPSDQELSDPVEEMLRKQIKVIDNMSIVLEEMRAELVRNL